MSVSKKTSRIITSVLIMILILTVPIGMDLTGQIPQLLVSCLTSQIPQLIASCPTSPTFLSNIQVLSLKWTTCITVSFPVSELKLNHLYYSLLSVSVILLNKYPPHTIISIIFNKLPYFSTQRR